MCGIVGIYHLDKAAVDKSVLNNMTRLLHHRGPDDEGYVLINTQTGESLPCHHADTVPEIKSRTADLYNPFYCDLGLGFRRLSIIDLTAAGHQPMTDSNKQTWIVYNGEIYNYLELRSELKSLGHTFKSKTDTEVILKAYDQWGDQCVHKFNGMWAFALWDNRKKALLCSRDRFGIKPFYYCHIPGRLFIFASEIKALLQVIKAEADYSSISDFLMYEHMDHSERTFFNNICQLRGSHSIKIQDGRLSIIRYFDVHENTISCSKKECADNFREILFDAVRIRLRSDVPLGYALSGGVDSSSIAVAAKEITSINNTAFSIVFPGSPIDESYYIKKVIQKTGFKHRWITPTGSMLIKDIDKFIWHQEEPNNGTSYYGEFKLRELIRESGVTVSLEGQGADEIITGYQSFIEPYLQDLAKRHRYFALYKELIDFKYFSNHHLGNFAVRLLKQSFPWLNRLKKPGRQRLPEDHLNSDFLNKYRIAGPTYQVNPKFRSILGASLYSSLFYYSIPSQLVRADKSAMAYSVECRFPFLDYRLVEFAFSIPFYLKIHGGVTKYILREAMRDYLPIEVYNRRDKIGFATPEDDWLRNEMKSYVEDIMFSREFKEMPFLNWKKFEKDYLLFSKEGAAFEKTLWSILSIHLWLKKFNIIN
jgi:asparagine synthase (glutamine-hydrolysing)